MFEEKRIILEPAGALALARAEAYCKFYNLKDINVGRQQEAVLTTFLQEKPESFKQFCELVHN